MARSGPPVAAVFLLLLALLPVLLAAPARAAPSPPPEVSGLRFGLDGPRTRVVLDFDRAPRFAVLAEREPVRLVVELEEVAWRVAPGPYQQPRGLARGYRFGRLEPGRSRLVVDMAEPFRVLGSILLPPSRDSAKHRLVIDLVADPGAGRPAVAAPTPAPRPPAADEAAGASRAAAGEGIPPPVPRPEPPVIVIDPGHGGIDPGAVAVNGALEKDIVLEVALELRRLIEENGRYRVALTRDRDMFISLRDRITKARELKGRVFISLHADSLRLAELKGASVYTLSETASDAEAARLASQENKADILAGTDLSRHDMVVATILLDLAQRDTNNRSIAFADLLAEELSAVAPMVRRHRRFAGFAVLKSPDIPSVLLELGYLSNPEDAENLAQPDYRAKLSKAIVRALDRFFAEPRT